MSGFRTAARPIEFQPTVRGCQLEYLQRQLTTRTTDLLRAEVMDRIARRNQQSILARFRRAFESPWINKASWLTANIQRCPPPTIHSLLFFLFPSFFLFNLFPRAARFPRGFPTAELPIWKKKTRSFLLTTLQSRMRRINRAHLASRAHQSGVLCVENKKRRQNLSLSFFFSVKSMPERGI